MIVTGFDDPVRDEILRQWEAAKERDFDTGLTPDIIADFIVEVLLISLVTVELRITAKGNRQGDPITALRVKKHVQFSTPRQLVTDIAKEMDSLQRPRTGRSEKE